MKLINSTFLAAFVLLILSNLSFAQDSRFKDPGIWNIIQRDNWYRDRNLPNPYYDAVKPADPLVYGTHPGLPRDPQPNFTDPPDIRVFPSSNAQSENSIAINLTNPNQLFISTNGMIPISPTIVEQTWFFSTNGGLNWFGSENIPPPIVDCEGDPVAIFNLSNTAFYITLGATGTGGTGIYEVYTTNFGTTWSSRINCDPINGTYNDKEHAMCDISGTYPNNIYCAWADFNLSGPPLIVTRSTDNGNTWSARQQYTTGVREQGCNIAVGPNGEVYIAVAHYPSQAETGIDFIKSTNGGASFSSMVTAFPISGIRVTNSGDPRFNNVRVNSFPHMDVDRSTGPRRGYIYIVDADQSTGYAEIKMWKSTDGGTTWSGPTQITTANSNHKWFPSIAVDKANGNIAVSYYNFDSVGFYASRNLAISQDGGVSWDKGRNSDVHWLYTYQNTPNTAAGYNGDYFETAMYNNKAYPCWSENLPGFTYNQAFIDIVNVGPPLAHDIAMGPWLSFPGVFLINTAYTIKGECTNVGTSNETNVPIKWFINGTLTNTTNKNLNAGQVDSVSNTWTPTVAGTYTLMYVSALSTDTNHLNDTLRTTVNVLSSLPALCEGFNSTTFPPTGWSIAGAGSQYWMYQAVSAYGYGQGSAYYDMWNAAAGTTADLISLTFPPTVSPQDSLHFALAFCMFSTDNDEIAIYSSTDAGTTYTLIHTMTATEMQTVSSCTHPFTPTSAQWGRRSFLLPVGTNKIKFTGISAFGDGAYLDSIGTNSCWNYVGITHNGTEIPRTYSLSQNYPNPFNPSTKIQFSLPKAGQVKLVIYNVLGAEVKTLVNENMEPGIHNITFDGENFASGVYFYKIEAGDFTAVKKMILIK